MKNELVVTDQAVVRIAKALGIRPQTLVLRIKEHLPSPATQQIYLTAVASYGMLPQTFAMVVNGLFDGHDISAEDFWERPVGPNLVSSPARQKVEYIEAVLEIRATSKNLGTVMTLSSERIVQFVRALGPNAAPLVDSIVENLEDLRDRLRMSEKTPRRVVVWAVMQIVMDRYEKGECPVLSDTDINCILDAELDLSALNWGEGESGNEY